MKPKADYFDNLVDRNLLTNLRDTAKQIEVPQKKFISLLIENNYLYRNEAGELKPYAKYTPCYFKLKDYTNEYNGHSGVQVFVTPEGKESFRLLWGGGSNGN